MTEELEKLLTAAKAREEALVGLVYSGRIAGELFAHAHGIAIALETALYHARMLDKRAEDEKALYAQFGLAPLEKSYKVEVAEDGDYFRHRLVCSDGRVSHWANYQGAAFLDDKVSITGYYAVPPHELVPITHAVALDYMCSPEDKGRNVSPEYFAAIKFPYTEEHENTPVQEEGAETSEHEALPGHPPQRIAYASDPGMVGKVTNKVLDDYYDKIPGAPQDDKNAHVPETPAEEAHHWWVPGSTDE